MSTEVPQHSRRMRAEAALWVARLHGPGRTPDVESGLRAWLARDPLHIQAFELATDVWQATADLPGKLPRRDWEMRGRDAPSRPGRKSLQRWGLVAAALAALSIGVPLYLHRAPVVATAVGEQRSLTLPDGSRIQLNTSTRVVQRYDERTRKVELESGEAWFDVVHDARRPFVVVAGGRTITALGTSFVVRRDVSEIAVTLLDGRVAVASLAAGTAQGKAPSTTILVAGQRLTLHAQAPASVDSPSLSRVTAWRRGQVTFEDTPLSEAMADFNRYSSRKLTCAVESVTADCAHIRVGGTFNVGDVESFARAVAAAHDLQIVVRVESVEIVDRATAP